MSLTKRKESSAWWIDFVAPNGERIRRSTQTADRKAAQELHDKLKSEVWRIQRLGDRPKRVWQEAAIRWLREQKHKASIRDDQRMLRWLDPFLADRDLESINRSAIEAIIDAKLAEGCSHGTVNRHLALMRSVLRRCMRDWEWIDRMPAFRLLKEPTRRIRFLTQTQALTLLKELPPHLRELATFGLATGLRAANITGLLWDQVDLARRLAWIHPDQAKARRAIAVPLNDMAMGVLGRCAGAHPEFVFTFRGSRIKQVSTMAWYHARKRAGLTDFRFHDLRHTWASWHIQHGTPLFALQELGGWETERMVRRYAHLSADHLAAYVGNTQIHGTFLAQSPSQLRLLDEKAQENP